MSFEWPSDFARTPDEDWTIGPVEELARNYDTVEAHGWYKNLEPTIADLRTYLSSGRLLMDYSAGTGILEKHLLSGRADFGVLLVDSSPKFLRLALEKFRGDERVAFRLIRYQKDESRLQYVDEVLSPKLRERGFDAIVSTNAIHLYYDLPETLACWKRLLRAQANVFVQSGNIGNSKKDADHWIIDDTVEAIHRAALSIVEADDRYATYRDGLLDRERMAAYDRLRRKFFLPVRPLDYYLEALENADLHVTDVSYIPYEATLSDWYEFLSAYHEGALGWIGGSVRIEGKPPADESVRDRMRLMRDAMEHVFGGRASFVAGWTYIRAESAT